MCAQFMRLRLWCDQFFGTTYANESDIDELSRPICLDMPRRYEPTLVLLDAGITVELSERDRCNFRNVFKALIMADGEHIADMLIEQAPDGGAHCVDRDGFRRELNALVQRAFVTPGTSTLKRVISLRHVSCLHCLQRTNIHVQLHIAELLSNLLTIVSTHHVLLEPNFTSVVLALMVLEGLGRSLDAELDLLTVARPFILHLQ